MKIIFYTNKEGGYTRDNNVCYYNKYSHQFNQYIYPLFVLAFSIPSCVNNPDYNAAFEICSVVYTTNRDGDLITLNRSKGLEMLIMK